MKDSELHEDSVVKDFLTTAADGKQYHVVFYALEMILAVGYRVKGKRGTQFRQWATRHLSEYLVKGFTMDDERLKNPNGQPDYFDVFLESAELRVKERKDLTLDFWRNNVNGLLTYHGKDVLQSKGTVSNAEMEKIVFETYERFDTRRKQLDAVKADQEDIKMLEEIVKKTKNH